MSDISREWQPRGALTDREMRVLNEIHAGSSVRDISLALHISENTVKNHVRNIIEKLRLFSGGSS